MRIIELLYDYDGNPGFLPNVVDLLGSDYDRAQEHLWRSVLRELDRQGLIKLSETMGFEGTAAMITDSGRMEVEALRTRRADPVRRNLAARDAAVRYLYAQPEHAAHSIEPLRSGPLGLFEGDVLSSGEIDAALLYLKSKSMVAGVNVDVGTVLRPRLTDRGIDCMEQFGGSVADYLRHGDGGSGSTTVNFNAPVTGSNVAWNSRLVTQTATTTSTGMAGDEIAALIGAIMQALPVLGLDETEATRLRGQLEVAEGELQSAEPDAGVVKSVLKRVLGKIGDAAYGSLGVLLTAYAHHLMMKA
ncbi:MAG TPA: hypothetical protein VGJ28_22125, partial [Micromonosporaceae bacterium]